MQQSGPRSDPHLEYSTRLDARRKTVKRYERFDLRIAQVRLATAVLFVLAIWLSLSREVLSPWWLLGPIVLFLALVIVHERVLQVKRRAKRAVAFYENGLARIEDRWIGRGYSLGNMDESHAYAADLDIFGKGSLFELLCTARTQSGEEILSGWLKAPAGCSEIRARQEALEELRNRLDLREDLAVLGPDIRSSIHPDTMKQWGIWPPLVSDSWPRVAARAFAASVVVTFSLMLVTGNPNSYLLYYGSLMAAGIFALLYRARVRQILSAVEGPKKDLEMLSLMLSRLERETFHSAKLVGLRSSIETGDLPPSRQIARLIRLIDLLTLKRSDGAVAAVLFLVTQVIFAPFTFLLWGTQIAFAVESWRRQSGPKIGTWLSIVGEFEALCALAGYTFEHPADPFPELVEHGPAFEGEDLRHPLLPVARCVPNSVQINAGLQLLVVSGSNMSGKSTLLRTVGINTVLGLAGAPVRARRLRLSPLAIGATLRIQDSLQAGTSRFYAEIQRIRQIMDLTGNGLPVLFLLDEVLHGTNSHDRAVGAEGIVRGLIRRGAIGLVTTHDLALAAVADALAPRAANVHFEDYLEGGKMFFSYRMLPGVVQKSNALELMRVVGLEI